MALTANDVWQDILAIFDELTKNGVARPFEKTQDMQAKALRFMSMCQREHYDLDSNHGTFSAIITRHTNLLGDEFDYKEHFKEDIETQEFEADTYYFEVDGTATVTIVENTGTEYSDYLVINATSENGFARYKGVIETDNPVKIVFGGSNYYRYKNVALWGIPFEASKIPNYGPFIEVELPTDFMEIADIIEENGMTYVRPGEYRIEASRYLYVPYQFEGEIRFRYHRTPTQITSLDDTLSVDDIHSSILAWYAAAAIAPSEQPDLVVYCEGKYQEAVLKTDKPTQQGFNQIQPHFLMRGPEVHY